MKERFSSADREKNAKLPADMTGRALGMSAGAFRELPELAAARDEAERLAAALRFVAGKVAFPAGLPAFEPVVCETLATDRDAVAGYEENPEEARLLLWAGGPGGTLWMCVGPEFAVGTLNAPFAVVGFTSAGRAVLRLSYLAFLRQFGGKGGKVPERLAKPVPDVPVPIAVDGGEVPAEPAGTTAIPGTIKPHNLYRLRPHRLPLPTSV